MLLPSYALTEYKGDLLETMAIPATDQLQIQLQIEQLKLHQAETRRKIEAEKVEAQFQRVEKAEILLKLEAEKVEAQRKPGARKQKHCLNWKPRK